MRHMYKNANINVLCRQNMYLPNLTSWGRYVSGDDDGLRLVRVGTIQDQGYDEQEDKQETN